MIERIAGALRGPRTRATGVVYFLYFATVIFGASLTPGTPNDILAHQSAFRWGFAITTISLALYVAVTALFYNLFKPVDRRVALLAAFFSLVGCVMQAVGAVFQLGPLVILGGSQFKNVFSPEQLHALAQISLDLNVQAGYVGIVFFGLFDIAIGYLILRSAFLPRILGALMAIAGLGWLIFLSPPLANQVLIYIEVPGFIAEAALMLWLLVVGVNSHQWSEQASPAGIGIIQ